MSTDDTMISTDWSTADADPFADIIAAKKRLMEDDGVWPFQPPKLRIFSWPAFVMFMRSGGKWRSSRAKREGLKLSMKFPQSRVFGYEVVIDPTASPSGCPRVW